mmetsp:Transcript_1758/g.3319  ORF Transcript_1758/g.3319 Transcript_1758/m.3319 type:complete len:272 (-) Transcript_1758:234-1049(-)
MAGVSKGFTNMALVRTILYPESRSNSFQYSLNALSSSFPDFGCYYHECFLRDIPEITCLIRRLTSKLGKAKPFAAGEPNFYKINEKYPLPPQKSSMQESQKACVPTSTKSSLSLSALPLSRAENTSSAAVKPRFVPSSIQDGSIFSMNPSVKGPAATLLPYDSPELMGRSGPVFSGPSDDFENLMHLTLGHHGEQCYSSSGSTHSEYQSSDHALFQSQSPNSTLAHRTYQELPMNTSSTMFCISHPENSCCPDGPFRREYIEDPFEPLPLS